MAKLPLPVPLLLTTSLVTWYYGVTEVAPVLYGEEKMPVYIGTFLLFQIFISWCGVRFVDSSCKNLLRERASLPYSSIFERNYLNSINSAIKRDAKTRISIEAVSNVNIPRNSKVQFSVQIQDHVDNTDSEKSHKSFDSGSHRLHGFCCVCNDVMPPRCHHCPVCKVCVLKRDHHCYFSGSCIGWRNHRYFVIFCFWTLMGSSYCFLHLLIFIHQILWSSMNYVDTIALSALVRCIMGYTSLTVAVYVSITSLHFYCVLLSAKFLTEHIYLITRGITTFENNSKTKRTRLVDRRTIGEKCRSVFGNYWLINWFVPTHFFFPPIEDPVHWTTLLSNE